MQNALTIDLEDYFHVSAFRHYLEEGNWGTQEERIARNTDLLLSWLDEAGCKATFFALGWVAERHSQVILQIFQQGHEIACHSLRHRIVYEMSPEEFREDTRRAKELLEDVTGSSVRGYRAPSFSITAESLWALEILAELGFTYDSSIFPVRHPSYGIPGISRAPFLVNTSSGPIIEFPLSTLELAGKLSPVAGGAYLRLLPYWYSRWAIRYLNARENRPVCVYLHPWEIDPEQPRMKGSLTARLRHRIGLQGLGGKLRRLLRDFEFCSLGKLVDELSVQEHSLEVVKTRARETSPMARIV
jgi:polysaccharide deacetylase family protein (PEP-CTERM system associated)